MMKIHIFKYIYLYTLLINNIRCKPVNHLCYAPLMKTFWTLDPFETFPKLNGTKISLVCASGHYDPLSRSLIEATCQNGRWNLPTDPCIRRYCVELPDLDNGRIFKPFRYNDLGGRAFVLCNDGFEMEGSALSTNGVLQCMMWLNNQTIWHPPLPRCVQSRFMRFSRPKRCKTYWE